MDQTYRIFTDGSAIGNPGPGGWGAVVMNGTLRWLMSGGCPRSIVSEMEIVGPMTMAPENSTSVFQFWIGGVFGWWTQALGNGRFPKNEGLFRSNKWAKRPPR